MMHVAAGAADPLSASFWPSSLGAFGVFLVLFAETGLLVGLLRARRSGSGHDAPAGRLDQTADMYREPSR